MRHQRVMKKFGRSTAHRKMLMKGLVTNLILAESIKTSLPKAKEARKDADRIVTIAKKGLAEGGCELAARRLAARRRAARSPFLATVTILSASLRASFAFGSVVFIDSARMRFVTRLFMSILRCFVERPNFFMTL